MAARLSRTSSGIRRKRLSGVVQHALAEIFLRETLPLDDDLEDLQVAVSEIQMSPDLRHARVYVRVGDPPSPDGVARLNDLAPLIRKHLARRLYARHVPELRFYLDHSFDTGQRIDETLRRLRNDRKLSSGDPLPLRE